jgi:tetratricopeptide (TPR) repeat protein
LICSWISVASLWLAFSAGPQTTVNEELAAAHNAEIARNYALAESIYVRILTKQPDAEIWQRLGLVRHLENKFEAASQAFQSALHLKPSLWTSHLFLGIDYYRLNRFSGALAHLKEADRLNPNVQETQFWLGTTELALHQYWEGFQALEGALEKDPGNTELLRLLAEEYAEFGTKMLNDVAEKYPDSAAGLEIEGKAFEFDGSYDAALDAYLKAAAKDPALPGIQESITRVQSRRTKPAPE